MPTSTAQRSAGPIVGGGSGRVKTIAMLPRVGVDGLVASHVPAIGVTRTSVPALIQIVGLAPQNSRQVRAPELRGWYSTWIATGRAESSRAVTRTSFSGDLEACAGPGDVMTGGAAGVAIPPGPLYDACTVRVAVRADACAVPPTYDRHGTTAIRASSIARRRVPPPPTTGKASLCTAHVLPSGRRATPDYVMTTVAMADSEPVKSSLPSFQANPALPRGASAGICSSISSQIAVPGAIAAGAAPQLT